MNIATRYLRKLQALPATAIGLLIMRMTREHTLDEVRGQGELLRAENLRLDQELLRAQGDLDQVRALAQDHYRDVSRVSKQRDEAQQQLQQVRNILDGDGNCPDAVSAAQQASRLIQDLIGAADKAKGLLERCQTFSQRIHTDLCHAIGATTHLSWDELLGQVKAHLDRLTAALDEPGLGWTDALFRVRQLQDFYISMCRLPPPGRCVCIGGRRVDTCPVHRDPWAKADETMALLRWIALAPAAAQIQLAALSAAVEARDPAGARKALVETKLAAQEAKLWWRPIHPYAVAAGEQDLAEPTPLQTHLLAIEAALTPPCGLCDPAQGHADTCPGIATEGPAEDGYRMVPQRPGAEWFEDEEGPVPMLGDRCDTEVLR